MYTQLVIAYIAAFSRLNKLKHGYDLTKIQTHIATCPDEMRCIAFLTFLVMRVSFFLFFFPAMLLKDHLDLWYQPLGFTVPVHFLCMYCMSVCVLDEVRTGRGMTITLENSMTTPQMGRRGSVTHLTATGLRESLWFSIQSQKNISNIWSLEGARLWSRNSEVESQREERGPFQLRASGLITLMNKKNTD